MSCIATSLTCYYSLGQESLCLFLLTHICQDQTAYWGCHRYLSVSQTGCFTLSNAYYDMRMDSEIHHNLAWLAKRRSLGRLGLSPDMACRAPECPTALPTGCSKEWISMERHVRSVFNNHERQPRINFHSLLKGNRSSVRMLYTEPQRTHQKPRTENS